VVIRNGSRNHINILEIPDIPNLFLFLDCVKMLFQGTYKFFKDVLPDQGCLPAYKPFQKLDLDTSLPDLVNVQLLYFPL